MKNVDLALATVRRELADVGVEGPLGGVGVPPLHRTLDVWFDNIISDLSTQGRIKGATGRVDALGSVLTRVQSTLGRRDREAHRPAGWVGTGGIEPEAQSVLLCR